MLHQLFYTSAIRHCIFHSGVLAIQWYDQSLYFYCSLSTRDKRNQLNNRDETSDQFELL